MGFPGGSVDKESTAMQKMQVHSLGQEDPLEEVMPACSGILAWRILASPKRKKTGLYSQLFFGFVFWD